MRSGAVLILLAVFLNACRGGDPLQYETAMALVKNHNLPPLKIEFSSAPRFDPDNPNAADTRRAYEQLMDAHVLSCQTPAANTLLCEPGAAGAALETSGPTELSMVAGHWVPADLSAINRQAGDGATATVRLTFEPTQFYHEFEDPLQRIAGGSGLLATTNLSASTKVVNASFQHYPDGWHLESVE